MNSRTLALGLVLFGAQTVSAQTSQTQQISQGPMTVERIHSGFLFAPDVKITEVDHTTSGLVGGYAGWVAEEALFIGGGGYWLANGSSGREMAYGGLIIQFLGRSNHRVGFGAKALLGGGEATLTDTFTELVRVPAIPPLRPTTRPVTSQIQVREGFFVAEPELDARVRLTKSIRLTGGIGYRWTSSYYHYHDDSRLQGAVASIGLQIGGGF
jgi:hypothetical protein